jgi:DNA-binding Lrp family transcriptional regulator
VLQFYFVTGSTDYLIMLSVPGMDEYDRFLQDHLVPDPLVICPTPTSSSARSR